MSHKGHGSDFKDQSMSFEHKLPTVLTREQQEKKPPSETKNGTLLKENWLNVKTFQCWKLKAIFYAKNESSGNLLMPDCYD